MKYIVTAQERHDAKYEVEADSPDEARSRVANGKGTLIDDTTEFVDVLPNHGDWPVTSADEAVGHDINELWKAIDKMDKKEVCQILADNDYDYRESDFLDVLKSRLRVYVADGDIELPEE
jgi:hypothetical protein